MLNNNLRFLQVSYSKTVLYLLQFFPNDKYNIIYYEKYYNKIDLSFCVSLLGPSHSNHDWQHMTNVPTTVDVVDTLITLLMQNFPVAVSKVVPALSILT